MNIPVYYVTYGDLSVLSLVEKPAIETDFQIFSEQKVVKFSLDEEKHIAFGPAMIADKPIYRIAKDGQPYYLVFTADIIEKMVLDAEKENNLSFSLEHSGQQLPADKVYMIESFISRKGLIPEEFSDIALGSWYVSLKIEDNQIWQDLKDGKYNGFSIECMVDLKEQTESLDDLINNILD